MPLQNNTLKNYMDSNQNSDSKLTPRSFLRSKTRNHWFNKSVEIDRRKIRTLYKSQNGKGYLKKNKSSAWIQQDSIAHRKSNFSIRVDAMRDNKKVIKIEDLVISKRLNQIASKNLEEIKYTNQKKS